MAPRSRLRCEIALKLLRQLDPVGAVATIKPKTGALTHTHTRSHKLIGGEKSIRNVCNIQAYSFFPGARVCVCAWLMCVLLGLPCFYCLLTSCLVRFRIWGRFYAQTIGTHTHTHTHPKKKSNKQRSRHLSYTQEVKKESEHQQNEGNGRELAHINRSPFPKTFGGVQSKRANNQAARKTTQILGCFLLLWLLLGVLCSAKTRVRHRINL